MRQLHRNCLLEGSAESHHCLAAALHQMGLRQPLPVGWSSLSPPPPDGAKARLLKQALRHYWHAAVLHDTQSSRKTYGGQLGSAAHSVDPDQIGEYGGSPFQKSAETVEPPVPCSPAFDKDFEEGSESGQGWFHKWRRAVAADYRVDDMDVAATYGRQPEDDMVAVPKDRFVEFCLWGKRSTAEGRAEVWAGMVRGFLDGSLPFIALPLPRPLTFGHGPDHTSRVGLT